MSAWRERSDSLWKRLNSSQDIRIHAGDGLGVTPVRKASVRWARCFNSGCSLMPFEDYEHPALTADIVLLRLGAGGLHVLLIQRGRPPYQGRWAFPGGFVDVGESPLEAAVRELEEETGIRDVYLEQLRAFGSPTRDPRGHTVTVAYVGVVTARECWPMEAGTDAAQARWWSVRDSPPLAFDHAEILDHALQRLRSRLTCALREVGLFPALPEELTLGDLRAARQAIAERLAEDVSGC